MPSLCKTIIGACALALYVRAAPIVTVTDIVTVTTWTTIDIDGTSTVWLPSDTAPVTAPAGTDNLALPSTTLAILQNVQAPVPALLSYDVGTVTTNSTSTVVETVQPTSTTTTTTTSNPVVTTPTITYDSIVTTTTTTTTSEPIATPATTVQTSTTTTVAASTTAAAASSSTVAAAAAATAVSASTSGTCVGESSACTGDITHWDGGLGACGWTVDTNSDMQIALPVGLMGSQSNGNPYCGKSVTIMNPSTGQTVSATVGDKCMGCVGRSIDLTDVVFNAITDGQGNGRVSGMDWWFN